MLSWFKLTPQQPAVATQERLPREHPGLGHLTYNDDDDAWTTTALIHGANVTFSVPGTELGICDVFASRAKRVLDDLELFADKAFEFLASYPGFGGIDRARQIFALRAVVIAWPEITGGFWMEFSCSADRVPDAIWRIEFIDWKPKSQSRDS